MYVLLVKDLLIIPYKHRNPFVLNDLITIEFPNNETLIFPVDSCSGLHTLTNEQLTQVYTDLHGKTCFYPRFDCIKEIQKFLELASESLVDPCEVSAQSSKLDIERTNAYLYVQGSRAAKVAPRNFKHKNVVKHKTLKSVPTIETVSTGPLSETFSAMFAQVNDTNRLDEILETCRKTLINQSLPEWKLHFEFANWKKANGFK